MPHIWLPLPTEQLLYAGLPTDYYPWTEVYTDLTAQPRFSGVLEVQQDTLQGRSVWVGGELRGSYVPGGDLSIRLLSSVREFARGAVSVMALEPALAQLIWLCREGEQSELPLPWPDARDLLADRRFQGALLGEQGPGGQGPGEQACSFWDDGRLLGGQLPGPNERLSVVVPRARVTAPVTQVSHQAAQDFWNEVLRASASRVPVAALWSAAATRLADLHPCLDPFAREVWWDGQSLQLSAEVPMSEVRGALLDQYRALLSQAGVTQRSLPLSELRGQALWSWSGLDE